jgi:Protein of unknown function (DUF1257)
MSHFTKCELKLTNLAAIKAALNALGMQFEEAEEHQQVVVRGYRGDTIKGKLKINMGQYDIGLIENQDGTYEFTADWWGVETTKGVSQAEFEEQVNKQYQYNNVKMACEEKGYQLEEEVNEEDGSIRLVVRKWVSD